MDSFFIRPERPEDIDAIFEVNLQAFAQDGEARLVNALRDDGDYDHELSLVAVSGDRIIGHILFPADHHCLGYRGDRSARPCPPLPSTRTSSASGSVRPSSKRD